LSGICPVFFQYFSSISKLKDKNLRYVSTHILKFLEVFQNSCLFIPQFQVEPCLESTGISLATCFSLESFNEPSSGTGNK
jgi:hypothetical protein